jgi:hypothetical protein
MVSTVLHVASMVVAVAVAVVLVMWKWWEQDERR